VDVRAGIEFSDDLIDTIVTKVVSAITTSGTFASDSVSKDMHAQHDARLSQLRASTLDAACVLEKRLRGEYTAMIYELDARLTSGMAALQSRVTALEELASQHTAHLRDHVARMDECDRTIEENFDIINKRHRHLELELLSVMEAKVNDTYSLVDRRLKKLDKVCGSMSRRVMPVVCSDVACVLALTLASFYSPVRTPAPTPSTHVHTRTGCLRRRVPPHRRSLRL